MIALQNRFSVRRIILHPGYNDHTIENDICLIQLNSDIDVDRFVPQIITVFANANLNFSKDPKPLVFGIHFAYTYILCTR